MEADIAITVALALFGMFVAAQIFRTWRTHLVQRTLREAILRGTPISPDMLAEAEKGAEPGANDLRNGMVLIALALAIAGFGLIEGGTDTIREIMGISLFPLFVGIALLRRVKMARRHGDA